MNLLLLLSALLSALSGLAGQARAVERQAVVACPSAHSQATHTARIASVRPAQPSVADSAPEVLPLPASWTLAVPVIERTLRRRE